MAIRRMLLAGSMILFAVLFTSPIQAADNAPTPPTTPSGNDSITSIAAGAVEDSLRACLSGLASKLSWSTPIETIERKVLLFMVALHQLVQWLVQHPLAAATMLYAGGVCGVLVYAFFEPRDQT